MIVHAALRRVNRQPLLLNGKHVSCAQRLFATHTKDAGGKPLDDASPVNRPTFSGLMRATSKIPPFESSIVASTFQRDSSRRSFSVSTRDMANDNYETFEEKFSKQRPRQEKKGANPDADRKVNATKLAIIGLSLICALYITVLPLRGS